MRRTMRAWALRRLPRGASSFPDRWTRAASWDSRWWMAHWNHCKARCGAHASIIPSPPAAHRSDRRQWQRWAGEAEKRITMIKEEDVLAALDKPRALYPLQTRLDPSNKSTDAL